MNNFRSVFPFRLCLGAVLCAALLTGCAGSSDPYGMGTGAQRFSGAHLCMGTVFSADLTTTATDPITDLTKMGNALEQTISYRIETSEIAAINASAGDPEGYLLSDELAEILEKALEISEKSGGAFDPTLGALTTLWKLDEGAADPEHYLLPTAAEVEQARALCGYEKVRLEGGRIYLPAGMRLDLGAIGKGIYLNRAKLLLEGSDTRGTISAGGSILTLGQKGEAPESVPWKIGIINPLDPDTLCGMIEARGGMCISTSGDYERYLERDGVRFHHILDPDTGYPVRGPYGSVTILCADGLLSDALSTACYVIAAEDPDRAIRLARDYDAKILLIDREGHTAGDLELLKRP
ncbi:MAG: FAD:protein FMN transferase [Lachnospiraceae bacterium]|nr:FAD:protein FMN transferase [Lachnospiraceae bacterium]